MMLAAFSLASCSSDDDNNVDEDIILTSEEEILRSNEKALIDASYALFETIGLTKNEIISELGEGNENAVVYASLIATSIVLDNLYKHS